MNMTMTMIIASSDVVSVIAVHGVSIQNHMLGRINYI